MKPRIEMHVAAPAAYKAMRGLSDYTKDCGLEPVLLELVKTRASQVNGCAFCIQMHTRDARKLGETDERLHLLPAWRETALYTPRERAALAWTEALTTLADGHAPDAAYEEVRAQFSEEEVVNLSLAIATINAWNRLAVGLRFVPKP
ncbi:MAG: carboxymuconolactone decarboxylase family protein [Proteobacteria bacterium]|nr:carboxymuconolactone decarboxylase family protein [Pseudomonadota bacterium]